MGQIRDTAILDYGWIYINGSRQTAHCLLSSGWRRVAIEAGLPWNIKQLIVNGWEKMEKRARLPT